jgi:hypothetical protein
MHRYHPYAKGCLFRHSPSTDTPPTENE